VGMGSLTHKLCRKLEEAIVRQIPKIQQTINKGVQDMQKELKNLGPLTANNRGAMVHTILSMCRDFDSSYATMLDGGKGGGEAILDIFEGKLTKCIRDLPFKDIYSLPNIKKVINEADGYQPHLIAPEMGYRRLIEAGLKLLKDPSVICVDEVYLVLQQLVQSVLGSKECEGLSRYSLLSAEILSQSGLALERMRDDAKTRRPLVLQLVQSKQGSKEYGQFLHKKSLLDKFVEDVAGKDAESLRRLLGENEQVMQRREKCSQRLELLQTAYRELTVSLSSR